MLKFKDYLTELFDKPVPFYHYNVSLWRDIYRFTVNDIRYTVQLVQNEEKDENDYEYTQYYIEFYVSNEDSTYIYAMKDEFKGNANAVMSTIVAICKEYFTKNKLQLNDTIEYTASAQSKLKTYKSIIVKYLKSSNIDYTYKLTFGTQAQFRIVNA